MLIFICTWIINYNYKIGVILILQKLNFEKYSNRNEQRYPNPRNYSLMLTFINFFFFFRPMITRATRSSKLIYQRAISITQKRSFSSIRRVIDLSANYIRKKVNLDIFPNAWTVATARFSKEVVLIYVRLTLRMNVQKLLLIFSWCVCVCVYTKISRYKVHDCDITQVAIV